MLRLIQFCVYEGVVWPLSATILLGYIFRIEARDGRGIPLALIVIACFIAPYFARYSVAVRYRQVKRILVNSFLLCAVIGFAAHRMGHTQFAMLLFHASISFSGGCLFWAVSDPAFELIDWLSFPTEHGRPPDEIHLLDHRIVALSAGGDSDLCWLFRYRYGNEWDVGLTGPFTFSLMGEHLDGKSIDEIYAAYGAWSSNDQIKELLGRGGPLHGDLSDKSDSPG